MLSEFIDFCTELFPSISPYTKEQAKVAMEQFETVRTPRLAETCDEFDMLQGDIFSEIPFYYTDEDGKLRIIKRKALLLSNTCDASRDRILLFAATHPLQDFSSNPSMVSTIKQNKKYSAFYLPDQCLADEYVDFELINSMSRETFLAMHEKKKVNRLATLTLVGYYMLICKMTVFFMRPEDVQVNNSRMQESL